MADQGTPAYYEGGTIRIVLVLIAGIAILIAGIGYALYTNQRHDRGESLRSESQDNLGRVLSTYGRMEGGIYLPSLMADPNLDSLEADQSAIIMVALELHDGSSYDFYRPSRSVFESTEGITRSSSTFVTVDNGDGRRLGGLLEVIIREA